MFMYMYLESKCTEWDDWRKLTHGTFIINADFGRDGKVIDTIGEIIRIGVLTLFLEFVDARDDIRIKLNVVYGSILL